MKEIMGKQVNRLLVNEDQSILAFDTDAGVFAYETYGDCCSHTWFDTITGVEALLGQTVAAVESIGMPEAKEREGCPHYQEELQDYGEKLTTAKGVVDIVYRNSSNGYYGGSIDYLAPAPDVSAFKEIADDWTAA